MTGPTWFQFYPRESLDESRKVLEQAQAAGCLAVVVTVDQQATFYERTQRIRNVGGVPRGARIGSVRARAAVRAIVEALESERQPPFYR